MLGATLEIWREALDAIDTPHPKILKPQLLRRLYDLLLCLSLDSSSQRPPVKFTDICNLSNFLFKEFSRRFEQLFSDIGFDPANVAFGQGSLRSDTWDPPRDLTILLRCCMVMLHLLEFDQALLLEKCQTLLTVLSKLCSSELVSHISCRTGGNGRSSIRFRRSVSRECIYDGEGGFTSVLEESKSSLCFVQQCGSFIPFLRSIIEVFIDELLAQKQLRQYFMMVDTVSCTNEKLFMCHLSHSDSDAVLELISAHFLLSVFDEHTFKKSLETLFPCYGEEPPFLELSLTTAMPLLGTPAMSSAPLTLQAYIISLVARCIGTNMGSENQILDQRLVNFYISSFERSFFLYARHMTSLQLGDHPDESKRGMACSDKPGLLGGGSHPSFKSYVRPVTYNQITVHATKFGNSSHLLSSKKKSDLLNICIAFMKENQNILDESHKDEILSILKCIISRMLSGEIGATILQREGDISQQEMFLLVSQIKLMSSSLLQTIWSMRSESVGCVKTLKDYSQCREYDFIICIIGCFQQFKFSPPIQSLLGDLMANYPARHMESKLMFMHFAGLFLFSYESGLEILCKGCTFMMMTLMNLFIFEEGNLDALKPLPPFQNESLSSPSPNEPLKVLVPRRSSLIVASIFQKIQMLNLRMETPIQSETSGGALLLKEVEECVLSIEEENACNGEKFIKYLQGNNKLSDFDELADFIECKQGKDYSRWLKDREKYRKWKWEKMAVVRKSRRKRLKGILN